jgi:ribose/xylose/arabinose/galactoside ABC-type transport system permease subunit
MNGFLVTRFRAPSLITTWCVGAICYVVVTWYAQGGSILHMNASHIPLFRVVPEGFWWIQGQGSQLLLYTLIIVIASLYFFVVPQKLRAIGSNLEGAKYIGLRGNMLILSAFVLSGALAACAGIFWSLVAGGGQTTAYTGKELLAITCAVLGGTSMSGGYLSLTSVASAAYFWTALLIGVNGLNVGDTTYQQQLINTMVAVTFLLVAIFFGRRLEGPLLQIHRERRTK